jgi:hypothetical protein
MEPQYMIMGQAAGLAAAWAVRQGKPVADLDVAWLQQRLRAGRSVLNLAEAIPDGTAARSFPGIVVDDGAARLTGEWTHSMSSHPFVGEGYLHDENSGKGQRTVRFVPDLPADGEYEVRFAYSANPNRASNVPVTVRHADGMARITVNQKKPPALAPFVSLGQFRFKAGQDGYVEVGNAATDGYVTADAAQWIRKN